MEVQLRRAASGQRPQLMGGTDGRHRPGLDVPPSVTIPRLQERIPSLWRIRSVRDPEGIWPLSPLTVESPGAPHADPAAERGADSLEGQWVGCPMPAAVRGQ
jgi:hypothetical protein